MRFVEHHIATRKALGIVNTLKCQIRRKDMEGVLAQIDAARRFLARRPR